MVATCTRHVPLKSLARDVKLRYVKEGCQGTHKIWPTGLLIPGTYRASVHDNCQCNELVSLHNRHLTDRSYIPFDPDYWRSVANINIDIQPVAPMSVFDVAKTYTGRKRRVYYQAALEVSTNTYDPRWARINMFIKTDKIPLATIADKAPRAIQYRDPRYNILLAKWLKPYEEQFYKLEELGLPCIAKLMNPYQRAVTLTTAWAQFKKPIAILLDHKAFDSCVRYEHLKTCHKFYNKACKDKFLRHILLYQLLNKGRTRTGIRYKVRGTKMSGDYDTALGNTLINYLVLKGFLKNVRAYFLVDGDDSVVIIDLDDLDKLDFTHFGKCGFETTVEQARTLEEIEFCRGKLLADHDPRLARGYKRALSNYQISTVWYPPKPMMRYLKGVAVGELGQVRGVPILEAVMSNLLLTPGSPIFDPQHSWKLENPIAGWESVHPLITNTDRIDYEMQWAVPVVEQLMLENADPQSYLKSLDNFNLCDFFALDDAP